MKTLISITYSIFGREETLKFIRKGSFKPTYIGAARMVSRVFNEHTRGCDAVKASDISVCRIETIGYL